MNRFKTEVNKNIAKLLLRELSGVSKEIKEDNIFEIEFDKELTTYNLEGFITSLRKHSRLKIDGIVNIIFSVDSEELFIYSRLTAHDVQLISHLKNKEIIKALREVLGLSEEITIENSFYSMNSSYLNHYNVIINSSVLKILLSYIMNGKKKPYHTVQIPKGINDVRVLRIPNDEYMDELKSVNRVLQRRYDHINDRIQVAYKKDRNIKYNASIHKNNPYWFKTDITNFFESCHISEVKKYTKFLFENTPNRRKNLNMFAKIITHNDALYLGNPVSGTLANVILSEESSFLNKVCKNTGMKVSIYADDILFSSKKPISKNYIFNLFERALNETGRKGMFKLKREKSYGMTKTNRNITGMVINNEGHLTARRSIYRYVRVGLYKLSRDEDINYGTLKGRLNFYLYNDDSKKLHPLIKKYKQHIEDSGLLSKEQLKKVLGDMNEKVK